jgi:hypothetical protein
MASASPEASSEKIICRFHIFGYNAARSSRRREENLEKFRTLKASAFDGASGTTVANGDCHQIIFAAVSPGRREKYSSSFFAFFRSYSEGSRLSSREVSLPGSPALSTAPPAHLRFKLTPVRERRSAVRGQPL